MTPEERFQRAETSLKEIQSKLPQSPKELAIAYFDEPCCVEPAPVTKGDVEYLETRLNWLQEDLNYLRDSFWKHQEGHLPKIIGATAMKAALKALGLDDEYEVEKKTIYANDGSVSAEQFVISKPISA